MAYKIEYILLIGILSFLLYHLLGSCNCNDGFSVGGCMQEIDSCSNKMANGELKNTPCNQLYQSNQYKGNTKCIVDTQNASNCVPTDILCNSDPMNPTNLQPISIDDIKKSKSGVSYYINANEILIILKSNGSQTLEIDGGGTSFLNILGNIYIESEAILNINNFQINYHEHRAPYSAATIINNGELNISNHRGTDIFSGIPVTSICKLTNNGIITFQGINKDSINSEKRTYISMVTYNNIDITGTGEIIYNNAGTTYNESVNIDNTQTFNKCAIYITSKSLSFNKPLTLNMSGIVFDPLHPDMTITTRNITIDKSYMEINSNFTSDNMTITDSNIKLSSIGKLNSKNMTMDDKSSIMGK